MQKILLSLLALGAFAPSAQATSPRNVEMEILGHPILAGLEKLLNEKHQGQCRLPATAADIQWMCMGALPPVTEPVILSNGCGFAVEIQCPGESARVSGNTRSFFLLSPRPTKVKPTDMFVTIDHVSIDAN